MPAAEFEPRLHAAAEEWVREGIVTAEQAERIRARHPLVAEGPGGVATLLYATAGVLLGAAGIALVAVGFDRGDRQYPLAAVGAALGAAGVLLRVLRKPLLGDAFLVGALPPLVTGSFGDAVPLRLLAVAAPVALLAWRREGFVPPLSAIAFSVAAASASLQWGDDLGPGRDWGFGLWAALQAALVAGVVLRDRLAARRDDAATAALAVVALAVSLAPFFGELVELNASEAVQGAVGACLLALVAAGAWMRHRGVVLGAAVGLAVDAIVFGFDAGGPVAGTLTLLAVAGLLVWQAELVKRFFRG